METRHQGREGKGSDHPEVSGWDADGRDKGAGGGGHGWTSSRGQSTRRLCPGDG